MWKLKNNRLPPLLFNIYAEIIMQYVLQKWDRGICIGGSKITNLRYSDDTALIAVIKYDIKELFIKVKRASEEA